MATPARCLDADISLFGQARAPTSSPLFLSIFLLFITVARVSRRRVEFTMPVKDICAEARAEECRYEASFRAVDYGEQMSR